MNLLRAWLTNGLWASKNNPVFERIQLLFRLHFLILMPKQQLWQNWMPTVHSKD